MFITVEELQRFLDRVDPNMPVLVNSEDNPSLKRALVMSDIIDGLVDAKAVHEHRQG